MGSCFDAGGSRWSASALSAATCSRRRRRRQDGQIYRSGVEVITVAATVFDSDGALVPDLPREAFELYDDGEVRPITQFSRERVPVGLGLLLDISDSMYGRRMSDARSAVTRFLELLDPADEFFVYAFNHGSQLVSAWTRDEGLITTRMAALQPSGGTAVYDAVADRAAAVQDPPPAARRAGGDFGRRRHRERRHRARRELGADPQRRVRLRHRHRSARSSSRSTPGSTPSRCARSPTTAGRAHRGRDRHRRTSRPRPRASRPELNSQLTLLGYNAPHTRRWRVPQHPGSGDDRP